MQLNYKVAPLLINLGGVSLLEVLDGQPNPTALLKSALIAQDVAFAVAEPTERTDGLVEDILDANKSVLSPDTPNLNRESLIMATTNFMLAFSSFPNLLKPHTRKAIIGPTVEQGMKMLEKVDRQKERLFNLLTHPSNHPEYQELISFLAENLQDEGIALRTLFVTDIVKSRNHLLSMYRFATEVVSKGEDTKGVYAALIANLDHLMKELPQVHLNTLEDFSDVQQDTESDESNGKSIDWTSIKSIAQVVHRKLSGKPPQSISLDGLNSFDGLVLPVGASISIPKKGGLHVSILLRWQNQDSDKPTFLQFIIDPTKEEVVDWTLLPPVTDAPVQVRLQLLHAASTLLVLWLKQNESQKITPQGAAVSDSVPKKQPKIRYGDPVYDMKRAAMKKQEIGLEKNNVDDPMIQYSETLNRLKGKKYIDSSEPDFAEVLAEVPIHQQDIVLSTIKEFNTLGTGGFKRLSGNDAQDRPRYRLRITTPTGELRALCTLSENVDGLLKFKVTRIGARQNFYRR